MESFKRISANEFVTLMDGRYHNWRDLLSLNWVGSVITVCNLSAILGVYLDIHDIQSENYQSVRIMVFYKHIVENENELILWRLL